MLNFFMGVSAFVARRPRSSTLTSRPPIPTVMAEVTAASSSLMGAVNKIKDSALHVFSQVRARARYQSHASPA